MVTTLEHIDTGGPGGVDLFPDAFDKANRNFAALALALLAVQTGNSAIDLSNKLDKSGSADGLKVTVGGVVQQLKNVVSDIPTYGVLAGIVEATLAGLDEKADLVDLQAVSAALTAKADLSAIQALNGAIASKLTASSAALMILFDALPVLPSDPASYPAGGGLFREGDANGYRLVRILPA